LTDTPPPHPGVTSFGKSRGRRKLSARCDISVVPVPRVRVAGWGAAGGEEATAGGPWDVTATWFSGAARGRDCWTHVCTGSSLTGVRVTVPTAGQPDRHPAMSPDAWGVLEVPWPPPLPAPELGCRVFTQARLGTVPRRGGAGQRGQGTAGWMTVPSPVPGPAGPF
jgi:hypothetical protein